MNELQNFIIRKGLEKASLECIKQAIRDDSSLTNDTKDILLGVIRGLSISKDICDVLTYLRNRS